MEPKTAGATLDRRGKTISTSVAFDAARELRTMRNGDLLYLLTDDFEPLESDVAAWCAASGNTLVESTVTEGGRRYVIEKGPPAARSTKLAIVVSSDGLEELLSPLAFALAAALEGIAVHLYVQGPAVRVLSHGFRPRLRGWGRPFSRLAASGMARTGHAPAQEKLRQMRELGSTIYVCGPSMEHFKVAYQDLIFPDLRMVEYLSFMAVMADADIHIYS